MALKLLSSIVLINTTFREISMRLLIKAGTLLGALFLAVSNSQAGLVVDLDGAISGNVDYYAAGENDILGDADGYFGAQIYVTEGTTLKFEFLGAESWWRTVFKVKNEQGDKGRLVHRTRAGSGNHEKIDWGGAKYNQPFTMSFEEESLLDFIFKVSKLTPAGEKRADRVRNGVNPLPEELLPTDHQFKKYWPLQETAFWTGLDYGDNEEGGLQAIYLGFNDGWSRHYDFDDMVIKITDVTPVPLPASIPLFIFSLMSLGFFKRK
jgi:hypothetical protein